MAEGGYGGYDYEFVEGEVNKKFQCLVCQNVLRDPMLTDCCGQHYCKSCLDQCSRSYIRECPHCRKSNYHTMLDIPLQREIKELEIYCQNRTRKKCLWEGELGSLQQHLRSSCPQRFNKCNKCGERYSGTKETHVKECPKAAVDEKEVTCKFEGLDISNQHQICGKKMQPDELKSHQTTCMLRPFQCKFCKMESTYTAITGLTQTVLKEAKTPEAKGHYAQCPDYPLQCKNKCSSKVIRRGDMEQHLQECPLELIQCERWEEGCKEMILRKDLKKHMKKFETQHNNYISSAYFLKKEEIKNLRSELSITKDEVVAIKYEANDLRAELSTTKDELSAMRVELATTKMTLESKTRELDAVKTELTAKTAELAAKNAKPKAARIPSNAATPSSSTKDTTTPLPKPHSRRRKESSSKRSSCITN